MTRAPSLALFFRTAQRHGFFARAPFLVVSVHQQRMWLYSPSVCGCAGWDRVGHETPRRFLISTSRFGIGQRSGSNCTPLGLHRIASKIGAGQPIGTVFCGRQAVGLTWKGMPAASIVHRILWLEGLEPGHNKGGSVDSHSRFIYIHGTADEETLGRPASSGCIHMAAADLLPLFDTIQNGTFVWIER